jgi:hypothetical protein
MQNDVLPTLSGTNAILRKVRAEDVEGFFALEGDAEIHEMFGGSRDTYRPMTRESAEAMVKHLSAPICMGDRAR